RAWAAARATRSRPASTARRDGGRPIWPRRCPSPTIGCRPTASPLPATISARASTRSRSAGAWRAALMLRARLAWAHDWIRDPTLAAVFQALPGASFLVNGATPAKNSALTSAGAEYRLANGVTLLAKFDGEFAAHSSTYAGTGTVRYTW